MLCEHFTYRVFKLNSLYFNIIYEVIFNDFTWNYTEKNTNRIFFLGVLISKKMLSKFTYYNILIKTIRIYVMVSLSLNIYEVRQEPNQ